MAYWSSKSNSRIVTNEWCRNPTSPDRQPIRESEAYRQQRYKDKQEAEFHKKVKADALLPPPPKPKRPPENAWERLLANAEED